MKKPFDYEKINSEIGNKYGRLTIIAFDEETTISRNSEDKNPGLFYKCRCECGNEKTYQFRAIKSGHTKSCGCIKKDNPKIMHDLTGMKFGRLTVINRNFDKNTSGGNVRWNCICECGNKSVVAGYNLEHGISKSCGCIVSEMITERNKKYSPKKNHTYSYKENSITIDGESIRVYDENNKYSFLVDKEDYEYISKWYWRKNVTTRNGMKKAYWVTNAKIKDVEAGSPKTLKLHQLIAERKYGTYDKSKYVPDHLSRDIDDNRKCNIVLKTYSENAKNRSISKANNSGKTGVLKTNRGWEAYITVNYNSIKLGVFPEFDDAVKARKEAEKRYGFTCDDVLPDYDTAKTKKLN